MKTETKVLIITLIISLALIVSAIFFLSKSQLPTENNQTFQINYSLGEKLGSDSAKIKLVEFSDYQCPACAAFSPIVKNIVGSSNNEIQLIYRHYPLPQHKNAPAAINAAKSAGTQGKFWEMHDRLFATQDQWANLADPTDFFVGLSKELSLDETKIREDIQKNTFKDIIQTDLSEGQSYGISATPTFFINGKKLDLTSLNDLSTVIEEAKKNL